MKKNILTTVLLLMSWPAFAEQESTLHTVTAAVKVATEFCHGDKDAAYRQAKEYCAYYGYREDECNVLSLDTIEVEDIYESSGHTYRRGEPIYLVKRCTAQATFKMQHRKLGPYDVLYPLGAYIYTDLQISVIAALNQTVTGPVSFRLESIVDSTRTESHLEFHMTLGKNQISRVVQLGKVCIDEGRAYELGQIKVISNENFSLFLDYPLKSKLFDGCPRGEIPVTGTIKFTNLLPALNY